MGLSSCDDLATEYEDETILFDHNILHDIPVKPPNGLRCLPVGGMRERHFIGINFKPRNLPENAQTLTTCPGVLCAG
jgi:hypothetical protein